MATFAEVSKEFAERVLEALRQDQFTKSASLSEGLVQRSRVTAELKEISRDLDVRYTVDGKPLTDDQKDQLTKGAGEYLGLPDPGLFGKAVRGASNDAYMELLTDIGRIVRDKKK